MKITEKTEQLLEIELFPGEELEIYHQGIPRGCSLSDAELAFIGKFLWKGNRTPLSVAVEVAAQLSRIGGRYDPNRLRWWLLWLANSTIR